MTPLIEDKTNPSGPGPKLKRFYKLFSFIWTFYMLNQLGGANMWRRRVCGGADPMGPGGFRWQGAGFWLVFVTDTLLINHPQVWAPRWSVGPGEVWGPEWSVGATRAAPNGPITHSQSHFAFTDRVRPGEFIGRALLSHDFSGFFFFFFFPSRFVLFKFQISLFIGYERKKKYSVSEFDAVR